MNETPLVESKAAELRQAFDLSFALPPPPASQEVEDLLTIRVAGDPYAIRLGDIAGMVAGRKVVPVPAVTLDLLGLAGIRGGVVPVFGLASILGYGQSPVRHGG
jgi:chemotaxis signal transduction protein